MIKISELKQENLINLPQITYAIFDEQNILCDISHFTKEEWGYRFDDLYQEFGGYDLKEFKSNYKTCTMCDIKLIKKPND